MATDILKIPDAYQINTTISPDTFFTEPGEHEQLGLESIGWFASIKPYVAAVTPHITEHERIEELNIFELTITQPGDFYSILNAVGKAIKYHCLYILKYDNKRKLVLGKFRPHKRNTDENAYLRFNCSRWIHLDLLSDTAKAFLDRVNGTLNSSGSLKDVINRLDDDIDSFKQEGLSRAHVDRLIKLMHGKMPKKDRDHLLRFCDVYKYYPSEDRFGKSRSNQYILCHDPEDIWVCFLRHEASRALIERAQYKDIAELMYYQESQYAHDVDYSYLD